ncbi:MAG: bifunctional 5,10-methylenetetrahydrofolate dehydrogenase/5,10-methenyltetrahydrofolate cyclohydrolase [Promethearchaeota archaeon]
MVKILNGKKLAEEFNAGLKASIADSINKTNIVPKLATILVGEDPASQIYVNIKHRTCGQIGIDSISINLDKEISKDDLFKKIKELNENPSIHGILLQLPLPGELNNYTHEFLEQISPIKDVDGFHPINRGKLFDYNETLSACTPRGIVALFEHYGINLKGKDIVIINRSNLIGKPLIFMLLKRNATVTVCHTSTKDIESHIKRADILVVAVGRPKWPLIKKDTIKQGVIIIDVGIHRIDNELCGDVDYDNVFEKCSYITPVPGGVGPLTVSYLMQNTYTAYKLQMGLKL